MIKAILIGTYAFALFVITHWILFCFWKFEQRSRILIGLTQFYLLVILLYFAGFHFSALSLWREFPLGNCVAAMLAFACLWFLYMPFYYSIQDSFSIGMLIHLIRSEAASVPISDLRPDPKAMIQHRLDRMVTAGFIDLTPEGYRLTPKGRRVSGFFRAVKAFWKLGPGG